MIIGIVLLLVCHSISSLKFILKQGQGRLPLIARQEGLSCDLLIKVVIVFSWISSLYHAYCYFTCLHFLRYSIQLLSRYSGIRSDLHIESSVPNVADTHKVACDVDILCTINLAIFCMSQFIHIGS